MIAHPEVADTASKLQLRMPRVLTYTEGNTEAFDIGENVEIRRSHQAVACKKRYAVELGKPQRLQVTVLKEIGLNCETDLIGNKRTTQLVGDMLGNQRASKC